MKKKAITIRTLKRAKKVVKESKFTVAIVLEVDGVVNARAMKQLFGADWTVHNAKYLDDLVFYGESFRKIVRALILVYTGRDVDKSQVKTMVEYAKKVLDYDKKAAAEECLVGCGNDEMTLPDRADDVAREVNLLGKTLRSRGVPRKAKEKALETVREAVDAFLREPVKLPRGPPKQPNE